jgi:hypothetical protein
MSVLPRQTARAAPGSARETLLGRRLDLDLLDRLGAGYLTIHAERHDKTEDKHRSVSFRDSGTFTSIA